MYIALRPIKFDKEYLRGDHIADDVVFPNVAQTLISAGYITYVDEELKDADTKNKKADEVTEIDKTEDVEADKVEFTDIEAEDIPEERNGFSKETLEEMTVSQLKELLTVNGIEFDKKSKKDDLIKAFLKG